MCSISRGGSDIEQNTVRVVFYECASCGDSFRCEERAGFIGVVCGADIILFAFLRFCV